jgi:biotin carboxylase
MKLLVLGASNDQIPVYTKAKELGIKTIAVDYNPNSPAFEYADEVVIASIKHPDKLLSAIEGLNFNGVMTLGVEISPTVSMIAKKYNLIAVDEETALATTNKGIRSMRLNGKVPIPKFQIVSKPAQITMQLPFVIKPSDSSASRGVRRVDYERDINEAFDNAIKHSSDGKVVIEELLKGSEISIEGFMYHGKLYVTGFADRNYSTFKNTPEQPLFIENGSLSPSRLSDRLVKEAHEVFEKAALECGITDGPTKGDLIVTKEKVVVIEVTSRLSGGGFCSRIQPLQNGTDIVKATIQWHMGLPIDIDCLLPKFNQAVCHRFYIHQPGEIVSITGFKLYEGIIHLVKQYDFKVGDMLSPLEYINRLFYVISQGDTRKEALMYAESALNKIKILTRR